MLTAEGNYTNGYDSPIFLVTQKKAGERELGLGG